MLWMTCWATSPGVAKSVPHFSGLSDEIFSQVPSPDEGDVDGILN